MVDVYCARCLHETCTRMPSFNIEGSQPAYCKLHAKDGMVNVHFKRCSHASRTKLPSFNMKGSKTAEYCKQHAKDGMVDVRHKRCSQEKCTKNPSFNFEGSKTGIYCKDHAENGMVNVALKRICPYSSCNRVASWGLLANSAGTACGYHKNNVVGGPVVNFRLACIVAGCRTFSTWGLSGNQPSHCHHHGPQTDGLVLTVQSNPPKIAPHSPSDSASSPSFNVKTEGYF